MKNKIAIIGESCIDEYVYGTCERVCPEAAALCFKNNGVKKTNLGMAAIIKRRFVDDRYNAIVFREDINDQCERIDLNNYDFSTYGMIIFSDYCKGFLTEQDIIDICLKTSEDCYIFIDTKKKIKQFAEFVDFIKINKKEYMTHSASDINYVVNHTKLIVTQGDNGTIMYDKETQKHYPAHKVTLRDVSGAGDTFMAALALKFLQMKDINTSIDYANECSAKVVSKFGVCVP